MKDLRELANLPATPNPDVCLYGLAMSLRGSADGSAEGTLFGDEPSLVREYLYRRLEAWGPSRSRSEGLFKQFLIACIEEAETQGPWLFNG